MSEKIMFARVLNLDYLNNMDQNQLDLSDNDMTKNINNLQVSMKDNKVNLTWTDCVDNHWKQSYIVRGENTIPTSVYNGNIVTSYNEKNKYSKSPFIDENIEDNMLYCYRVFSEMDNEAEFYSGFKNIFYVYVSSVESNGNGNGQYVPATKVIQDPLHKFVTENQITSWNNKSDFSGNYDDLTGKPTLFSGSYTDLKDKPVLFSGSYNDLTDVPEGNNFSGKYEDLIGKPVLSPVATSGSYFDLKDKPDTNFATVARTGKYSDLSGVPVLSAVALSGSYNDLTDKPTGGSDFSGSYNDLTDKPELSTVATSGSYTDLTNKPTLFSGSYNDLTEKPDIYTKTEIDNKFDNFNPGEGPGSASPTKRYKADSNGDCYVVATGSGVTFTKEGINATITVPQGVELLSAQVRFSSAEIATNGKCKITYGSSYNYTDNLCIPAYSVMNDVDKSRAYNIAPVTAANLNSDDGNSIEFTGLKANIGIVVKLTF